LDVCGLQSSAYNSVTAAMILLRQQPRPTLT